MSLERRQAWPALAIMWIGILTLAITLKAAQNDMPIQPPWIMGALGGLYLVLALLAEGFSWRSPILLTAMVAAHALMALLCGFGYAAVEGQPRDFSGAFQHGLWDYLPGTALQFGFACLLGIVLDAWLEPAFDEEEAAETEPPPAPAPVAARLPDVAASADLASALQAAVGVRGVAAALAVTGTAGFQPAAVTGSADTPQGLPAAVGVWERDPQAAWQRVQAMIARAGAGLNSVSLGQVSLLIRSENGQAAALLVTAELEQTAAHDLLRQLWAVGQREWSATE